MPFPCVHFEVRIDNNNNKRDREKEEHRKNAIVVIVDNEHGTRASFQFCAYFRLSRAKEKKKENFNQPISLLIPLIDL